ncbi:hypothetical protein ASPWEDRAFT_186162 [Aspergillus wentii DTO 134E9]|uniref:Uncharacterized protein n=1 Tax=Aspergillus wentii DTO 134E9 TaxID=1073089 RepID=A0A1L9RAH3_ASPWE|nr:uncharacterized protein ASPWEDRAFT_186162 [Aspergillus wentii DTO 134E9]KAI9934506.1 hypothetical protein MW887_000120 [Aspergillus wentii]OJJ31921.1 hypothetical protein ASPWEDRAFT_186162 [Aspergillus wentii DTO 134E9]
MKLTISILAALASINSVLAQDATCQKDAALVKTFIGQPYSSEISTQFESEKVRVYHEGDPITKDFVQTRLNIVLEKDSQLIQDSGCY